MCGTKFIGGPYVKLCEDCRKKDFERRMTEKYGSLENYYKERTRLGMQKKIERYGSIEAAYAKSTAKVLETKSHWTKEQWAKVNNKINASKQAHTKEQREETRRRRHRTIEAKYGSESDFAKINRKKFRDRVGEEAYQEALREIGNKISETQKNFSDEKKAAIKQKTQQTIDERYGSEEAFNKLLLEKRTKTNLDKYGVENVFASPEIIEKMRATRKEKYGDENYNNREKYYKTCLERYGTRGIVHQAPKYTLNGINFDSSWELAYYIWLVDQGKNFKFHSKSISYFDDKGKEHTYYPDFEVDGQLIEIKGDHLYRNGYLTSPSGRLIFYAKTKCYNDNNVKILTWKDIEPIVKYVVDKYGEHYLETFRVKKDDSLETSTN